MNHKPTKRHHLRRVIDDTPATITLDRPLYIPPGMFVRIDDEMFVKRRKAMKK